MVMISTLDNRVVGIECRIIHERGKGPQEHEWYRVKFSGEENFIQGYLYIAKAQTRKLSATQTKDVEAWVHLKSKPTIMNIMNYRENFPSGLFIENVRKIEKSQRHDKVPKQESRSTQIKNNIGGVVLDKGEVIFERDGISFRLTWVASKDNGRYGPSTSKILYNVYSNNNSIYPSSKGGGEFEGCGINNIYWQSLGKPQVGWMLIFKGI